MTVHTYDPAEAIGRGRTIIEASAGTGKTFTVAAVVTRLVAMGEPLERILVVTFTNAATAELKDRIRKRMVGTLRGLRGSRAGADPDDHLKVLLQADSWLKEEYAERLHEALTHFDRAQIFTIHGFSRRMLEKLGFRSRLSPDVEPDEVGELLLRRTAADLFLARYRLVGSEDEVATGTEFLVEFGKILSTAPDARLVPEPMGAVGSAQDRAEMARVMKRTLRHRLRAAGTITFDDTVVEARNALADEAIGTVARDLLQKRYSVALVDEAQDTDPIQWQVLRSVFDDLQLVVIGDPKQSIYAFRGADIESYLTAAGQAAAHRTLDANWRSDGPLIKALDVLLEGTTFGDDRIAYRPVRAAEGNRESRISGKGVPLEIRRFSSEYGLPTYRHGPYYLLEPLRAAVAKDVAAETVRLLNSDTTIITESEGKRPLSPGDFAVLCRTRRQVESIRAALFECQVPSVAARSGSVFATPAAEHWRRFLHAIERPSRTDYVRMAAATALVGLAGLEIVELQEEALFRFQQQFVRWQGLLHDHGVPTMFADIDRTTDLTARVLAEADGERQLTDLNHIAEEMHSAWRGGLIGSLVVWIEAAMDEANRNAEANAEDPESRQRRLETDAAAVQVQTIHAAKGLEYPVVMVPYLWDVPRIKPRIPVLHDAAQTDPGQPRRRLIDVGGSDGDDFEHHQERAMAEESAEESRLLYVALTRARNRLVVWWITNTNNSASTKLHEILTSRVSPGALPSAAVQRLIDASNGTIGEEIVYGPPWSTPYRGQRRTRTRLERSTLDRPLDYDWRRVSFSSLSPDRPLAGMDDTMDGADRVDESDGADRTADDESRIGLGDGLPMAELPRGARFGSLVHNVLRYVPFDAPDLAGSIRSELARLTRHSPWTFEVETFVQGMVAAMDTPLGPEVDAPTLRDLAPERTLKETDFELPVRAEASTISLSDLAGTVLEHLPDPDPHHSYFRHLQEFEGYRFRGYLAGGIDLMTVLTDAGRDHYVVMDFKSNLLRPLGESPGVADYGPVPLMAAMHHGNYVLQALIYEVALHRYLQLRFDGYDPRLHLGGSLYLFVRGMIGAGTPVIDGERCGVARWSPPAEAIVAVSDLFAGHR